MRRSSTRHRSRSRSRDRDSRRHHDNDYKNKRDHYSSRRQDNDYRDSRDRRRDDRYDREDLRREREEPYEREHSRRQSPPRTNYQSSDQPRHTTRGTTAPPTNGSSDHHHTNHNNKEPLSLEELLKRKQAEKEEEARPVFLTKQQRQELALKRRQEEADAHRHRTNALRHDLAQAAGGSIHVQPSTITRDRNNYNNNNNNDDDYMNDRERQRQIEAIKQEYLGIPKEKPKPQSNSNIRFRFEWDASEDTTKDINPLYKDLQEASLLFGRGYRAGIDRREQHHRAGLEQDDRHRRLHSGRDAHHHADNDDDRRHRRQPLDRSETYYDRREKRVNVHWSEKPRDAMTERDWRIFREDFNISFKGSITTDLLPLRSWSEAYFPSPIQKAIDKVGYQKPSPIQMATIPLGLRQRDVIGIAETGSGKTAAFVLPMLVYIMKQPPMAGNPDIEAEGPYAVVLAPTRELAQQIEEETKKLASYTQFRVVSIVGGQSIEDQGFLLRKGCEIVVATPGRLVDCIDRRYAVLNQCNYVVLDEADRMIDMGFESQVMGVLDAMPSSNLKPENEEEDLEENKIYRTTYMFSATMPPSVERLARKYLRRPIVVTIGTAGKATDNVTQRVVVMKENEKPAALEQELLDVGDDACVIVFVNTQKKCEHVLRLVENLGFSATMLHGGKTQDQREEGIRGFRENRYTVLVATDVAGRGIDVPNVALVINYDMPNTIEAYTHRIGRTGRAGRKGTAMTMLTMGDTDVFYDLKKFLEDSRAQVPGQLANHEAAKFKQGQQRQVID